MQLYEFLSLSSCDRYSKVLKTIGADIKILSAEVANRGIEIDTLKVMTDKKEAFVKANEGYRSLYEKIVVFDNDCKANESLKNLLNDVIGMMKKVKVLKEDLTFVEKNLSSPILQSAPLMETLKTESAFIQNADSVIRKYVEDTDKIKIDSSTLSSTTLMYDTASSLSIKGSFIESASQFLKVKTLCEEVIRLRSQKTHCLETLSTLKELTIPDDLKFMKEENESCDDIFKRISELQSLYKKLQDLKASLKKIVNDLEENNQFLETLKSEVGYCPYCNTVFGGSNNG
jgi:flagellar biosynthesis/type III secretory pathway chaperone